MKRLAIVTITGVMLVSAPAVGGIDEMFGSNQVGSFAYERVTASTKVCIYDYKDSLRKSLLHASTNKNCPDTVTDEDIYPDAHRAKEKESKWNNMYNKWFFDNYPHR